MPFYEEFEPITQTNVVNRTRTGPIAPPQRGVTQSSDGIVVGSITDAAVIAPATPIPVTMPGHRDRVLNSDGSMSPHWWRFFSELYRRTGAIEDNVNWATNVDLGSGTAGAVVLATAAPSAEITHSRATSVGSLAIASTAPTVS